MTATISRGFNPDGRCVVTISYNKVLFQGVVSINAAPAPSTFPQTQCRTQQMWCQIAQINYPSIQGPNTLG